MKTVRTHRSNEMTLLVAVVMAAKSCLSSKYWGNRQETFGNFTNSDSCKLSDLEKMVT